MLARDVAVLSGMRRPWRRSVLALALVVGAALLTGMPTAPAQADAQVASLYVGRGPSDIAIDSTGTYGYVVDCYATAHVSRIQLSTFTVDDSMALSGNCAVGVTLVDDSIYVTTLERLYRFNAATFGTSTDDSVAIAPGGTAAAVRGGIAYIAHAWGSAANQITKINVSTYPMTVVSSFASGGIYPTSLQLDPAGTYMYAVSTMSHSLTKIRLSDDSMVGSLSVGQQPYGLSIDDTGTYAYVPSASRETWDAYYTPPWLVRVDLGTFAVDDTLTLPFYWGYSVAVDNARGMVYVGQAREGGQIAKVAMGSTMSLTETFTVDNGPSALALSPTQPYLYSANMYDLNGFTVSEVAITSAMSPTVTGLSVSSGPQSGGGTTVISGTHLSGATGVTFGSVAATILSGSDDTIAVTVPAASSGGAANVRVTTASGTSVQTVPYTYAYGPAVTSMVPDSGPAAGGSSVTLSGTYLTGGTVEVGGTPVTPTVNTATSIEFVTPAASGGPAIVTVTTSGGTGTAGTFTYDAPPPAVPPAAPDAPVALAGAASAEVSWQVPSAQGSFAVSTYLVTSAPGGRTCMTAALSCRIDGLTPGTAYTFTVKALSGAGWSASSAPSNSVVPHGSAKTSILITGMRDGTRIAIAGRSKALELGALVTPWTARGSGAFVPRKEVPVSADGTFTWSRQASARTVWRVYVIAGELRSNTVTFR
ncbi:MAG: IPT/TIG domain-containing protein [bacterium]